MRKIALGLFLLSPTAWSETYTQCDFESPPTSPTSGGTYACALGSASLELRNPNDSNAYRHVPTGGYRDSGAAEFFTHTTGSSADRWLRLNQPTDGPQRNIRFLAKFASFLNQAYSGKWLVTSSGTPEWRIWLAFASHACGLADYQPELSYNNTSYVVHGQGLVNPACSSYQWCNSRTYGEGWYDAALTGCTTVSRYLRLQDYVGQWLSIELERNSQGHFKVYIDTQDGQYHGLYYWVDTSFSGDVGGWSVGAYLENPNGTGSSFVIDEVVQADSYIGPPAGFGTRAARPMAPSQLAVRN